VSHDRQVLREVPTGELRAIVAAGLYGKSREEIAGFAKEIGLTLAQLRELVSPQRPLRAAGCSAGRADDDSDR
jgi:hypothetical protein